MESTLLLWVAFAVFIVGILAVSVAASVWQARRGGSDPDPGASDPDAPDHPARPTPLEA